MKLIHISDFCYEQIRKRKGNLSYSEFLLKLMGFSLEEIKEIHNKSKAIRKTNEDLKQIKKALKEIGKNYE